MRDGRRLGGWAADLTLRIPFRACCAREFSVQTVLLRISASVSDCDGALSIVHGAIASPRVEILDPVYANACPPSLLPIENAMEYPALELDAVDLLLLFLRIVRGWSLGMRLTGNGVIEHVDEAFSGFCQLKEASIVSSQP